MSATSSRRPLVIGYGNTLRRDDGVGWRVARALADDPRVEGVDVIASHQLTPEHAVDVHHASLAVFVDAQVDGAPPPPPGHCVVTRLTGAGPDADGRGAASAPGGTACAPGGTVSSPGGTASSHHCSPWYLGVLARELYGHAPPMVVVGVGVASIEPGDDLTGAVASALPSIVDTVLALARHSDQGHEGHGAA